ncbi:hypothetical protein D9Q98_004597 [Chlorella vulgaris]|uniref:Uncharacterized protein n=1 Tax=Chlorella vulgaris TaxID=3077 RepID=A0A9D4TQ00_CHLVU|nr:hypothetical protein D9Q98_004597 [Chlorella vulgaris]
MSGGTAVNNTYSLAAECGSEMIGTCFVIYLGESIIANELLSKTKGARMGWLAVALGFGLSFGVVIMMLGYISAHLNPATCLALWVIGRIPFTHFLALAGAEFAGAFVGACLVFLHYIPHFKTVPEPMPRNEDDVLLRSRDALTFEALNIASYDTRARQRTASSKGGVMGVINDAIKDVRYYFKETHQAPQEHVELVEVALGPAEMKGAVENRLRRRSVQVCDVHRRLKDMSIEEFKEKLQVKSSALNGGMPRSASINLGELDRAMGGEQGAGAGEQGAAEGKDLGDSSSGEEAHQQRVQRQATAPPQVQGPPTAWKDKLMRHIERYGERQARVFDAAVIADQNAKLSIFCTRPAIYAPVFNFLTEVMCTTALVFGALMMYARRDLLNPEHKALFQSYEGMWIGFFVFVAILGLGGPTGIAANPARDFSPRLAHALLPIAGKGPSEWHYGWIPFWAPFFGGAAAGGLYLLVQMLNHSKYVA